MPTSLLSLPRCAPVVPGVLRSDGCSWPNVGELARQLVDCGHLQERDWTPKGLLPSIATSFERMVRECGGGDLKHLDMACDFGEAGKTFTPHGQSVGDICGRWHDAMEDRGVSLRDPDTAPDLYGGVAFWALEPCSVQIERGVRGLNAFARKHAPGLKPAQKGLTSDVGFAVAAVVTQAALSFIPIATPHTIHNYLIDYDVDGGEEYDAEEEEDSEDGYGHWLNCDHFYHRHPPSLFHEFPDLDFLRRALEALTPRAFEPLKLKARFHWLELLRAAIDLQEGINALPKRYYPLDDQGLLDYGELHEQVWPMQVRWNEADWVERIYDYHQELASQNGDNRCLQWAPWHLDAARAGGSGHPASVASAIATTRRYLTLLSLLDRVLEGLDGEPLPRPSLIENAEHRRTRSEFRLGLRRIREARSRQHPTPRGRARVRV